MFKLLFSHRTPDTPSGQTHCEPADVVTHFPLFIHGFFGVHDFGRLAKTDLHSDFNKY